MVLLSTNGHCQVNRLIHVFQCWGKLPEKYTSVDWTPVDIDFYWSLWNRVTQPSRRIFVIILWSSYIRYVFSFSSFLLYQFTELKNTVEYNYSMLIGWECTACALWHITISLCPMSYVALIDILKVLLDHLDKPYSDCLVNLRDQEHVDAYQEIHGTNYSMRVMPAQKIQYL